jgi:hypothetical protein
MFLSWMSVQCGVEGTMTPGHDRKMAEQADRMRELSIRLLVETDPEKAEALVAQLAEIVEAQRRVRAAN